MATTIESNAVYFADARDVFRGDLSQIAGAAVVDVRWPTYSSKTPGELNDALTPEHYMHLPSWRTLPCKDKMYQNPSMVQTLAWREGVAEVTASPLVVDEGLIIACACPQRFHSGHASYVAQHAAASLGLTYRGRWTP